MPLYAGYGSHVCGCVLHGITCIPPPGTCTVPIKALEQLLAVHVRYDRAPGLGSNCIH